MRFTPVFFLTGSLLIAPAMTGAEAPATAPTEVSALIARLGDPDFHTRQDAARKLKEIGAPAQPALKEALDDPSPEVRVKAAEILRSLDHHRLPGKPLRRTHSSTVSLSFNGASRTVSADDEGRQIHITQDASGIEMTVTGEVDGKPATETYKAKSADGLREDDPEAYALYERWAGGIDADWVGMNGGGPLIRGNIILPPVQPLGGDDLLALRQKVQKDIRDAKLPGDDERRVLGALDQLEQARRFTGRGQLEDPDKGIARYNEASDAFRKTLNDLKLPDPGEALPPPESSRLGISAPEDEVDGVTVGHVLPNSRGEKIGLKPNDRIRKVNGKEVGSVKDLRRLVTEHPKDLSLDIIRDGAETQLKE